LWIASRFSYQKSISNFYKKASLSHSKPGALADYKMKKAIPIKRNRHNLFFLFHLSKQILQLGIGAGAREIDFFKMAMPSTHMHREAI